MTTPALDSTPAAAASTTSPSAAGAPAAGAPAAAPTNGAAAPNPLEDLARGVDDAIQAVEALEPEARGKAQDLKQAIEAFHKEGLSTMIRSLKADPRGLELLLEMVEDPGVYALFAMHGLVKADLATRVAQVLDATRPYLQSHGGDVELVAIEDKTVKVRLRGACSGCSMSAVTLRSSVEEALTTRIPEIETVEEVKDRVEPAFVPLEALRAPKGEENGWRRGPKLEDVEEAKPYAVELDGVGAVIVRLGDQLQAFRNECAHQGLPIDGGRIDAEDCTLTCPWHGFRFDALSGECLTSPAAQLEPFPLRIDDGVIWIRPS